MTYKLSPLNTVLLFFICLIFIGCKTQSKEQLLLGKWNVTSWVDERDKSDLADRGMSYRVDFKSDTVFIWEDAKDNSPISREWKIENDSLKVKWLTDFKIVYMDDKRCVLNTKMRDDFFSTTTKSLHTETLTLLKE